MKPRSVLYIVIGLLLLVLVAKNWAVISPSTQLDLIFVNVRAPLGVLILLIAGAVLAVDFIVYSLGRRALLRQIEALRGRADRAEESRIGALKESVEREMAQLRAQLEALMRR